MGPLCPHTHAHAFVLLQIQWHRCVGNRKKNHKRLPASPRTWNHSCIAICPVTWCALKKEKNTGAVYAHAHTSVLLQVTWAEVCWINFNKQTTSIMSHTQCPDAQLNLSHIQHIPYAIYTQWRICSIDSELKSFSNIQTAQPSNPILTIQTSLVNIQYTHNYNRKRAVGCVEQNLKLQHHYAAIPSWMYTQHMGLLWLVIPLKL